MHPKRRFPPRPQGSVVSVPARSERRGGPRLRRCARRRRFGETNLSHGGDGHFGGTNLSDGARRAFGETNPSLTEKETCFLASRPGRSAA